MVWRAAYHIYAISRGSTQPARQTNNKKVLHNWSAAVRSCTQLRVRRVSQLQCASDSAPRTGTAKSGMIAAGEMQGVSLRPEGNGICNNTVKRERSSGCCATMGFPLVRVVAWWQQQRLARAATAAVPAGITAVHNGLRSGAGQ